MHTRNALLETPPAWLGASSDPHAEDRADRRDRRAPSCAGRSSSPSRQTRGACARRVQLRLQTTDDELRRYSYEFGREIGVVLPLEYMRQATVTAAFLDDDLVGGYMLVGRGPLRLLALVPVAIRAFHERLRTAAEGELLEVNGFWMRSDLRGAIALALLPRLCRDVVESSARNLLLGFDDTRADLEQLYRHPCFRRELIHKGPAESAPSLQTFRDWNIGLIDLTAFRDDPRTRRWLRRGSEA